MIRCVYNYCWQFFNYKFTVLVVMFLFVTHIDEISSDRSQELPKIPRQLIDRLTKFTFLNVGRSSFRREWYFSASRNRTVNSMTYRELEGVLISMSGSSPRKTPLLKVFVTSSYDMRKWFRLKAEWAIWRRANFP